MTNAVPVCAPFCICLCARGQASVTCSFVLIFPSSCLIVLYYPLWPSRDKQFATWSLISWGRRSWRFFFFFSPNQTRYWDVGSDHSLPFQPNWPHTPFSTHPKQPREHWMLVTKCVCYTRPLYPSSTAENEKKQSEMTPELLKSWRHRLWAWKS